MKITFWGTRGSIPAPGRDTVKYGGNTPCISLELNSKTLVILDAGTGIRKLGLDLMKNGGTVKAYMFITHSHWDHIQGIPFFMPIYGKNNEFSIISNAKTTKMLKQSLKDLLKHPYFPVTYESLQSKISFHKPANGSFKIGDTLIDIIPTNHPDMTSSYKFKEGSKTFIYMTDNEIIYPDYNDDFFSSLVSFCKDADILIHDAMYTENDYADKIGWGHSCFKAVVELAIKANVRKLIFFHHDPEYSDNKIDDIVEECTKYIKAKNSQLACQAAQEDQTIVL